jgi:hypothetical protein
MTTIRALTRQPAYAPDEIEPIQELSELTVTDRADQLPAAEGTLTHKAPLMANGINVLVLRAAPSPRASDD